MNWAVPPPRLIPSVLQKIAENRAKCTLIIPDWPSAPFYPILRNEMFKKHVTGQIVLARRNIIKEGLGNNGIFAKEPLSFNMLAVKFF